MDIVIEHLGLRNNCIYMLEFIGMNKGIHAMHSWFLSHCFCKFCQKVVRYRIQFQIIAGFSSMTITVMGSICIIVLVIELLPIYFFHLCYGTSINFTSNSRAISPLCCTSFYNRAYKKIPSEYFWWDFWWGTNQF